MPEELIARRLRTFFLGTEPSHNPLVPRLQAIGKHLAAEELCEGPGVLSARYGKRVIITTGGSMLGALKDVDFVELIDYDPQRHHCKILGKAEPHGDAGIHWLIYQNREEVGGIVHVHDPLVMEVNEATQMFPETKDVRPSGSVELAVEALKLLRKSPYFVLKGHGCIATGKTLEEALGIAIKAREQALEVVEEAEGMGDDVAPEDLEGLDGLGEPPPPPGPARRR